MITKASVTIKTPDILPVWEDSEKEEKDYTTEELKSFREKFAKDLHRVAKRFCWIVLKIYCLKNLQ